MRYLEGVLNMTIAELIVELQKLPQDARVVQPDGWFEPCSRDTGLDFNVDAAYIRDAFKAKDNVLFYM
jgi:hypothetical protein